MQSRRGKDAFPFEADEASDVPLWLQLRRRIAYLIESGYFSPGDKLPTVRGLASDVNINYNTVNKAYLSLASDGYIESTRGRGAFVLELPTNADDALAHEVKELVDDFIAACLEAGLDYDDVQNCISRRIASIKREQTSAESEKVVDIKKRASQAL